MDCPGCKYPDSRVIETRQSVYDNIRRRRECMKCGLRYTTEENIKQPKRKDK